MGLPTADQALIFGEVPCVSGWSITPGPSLGREDGMSGPVAFRDGSWATALSAHRGRGRTVPAAAAGRRRPRAADRRTAQGTAVGVTARPKGGIAAAALGIVQHSRPGFGRPGQTLPRSWPSTELRIAVMIARPARRRCMAHLLVVPRLAAATPDPREPPVRAVPPAGRAFLLLAGVVTIGG